jgi:hypothetical protein
MRRFLLLACLAGAIFATTAGTASAAVTDLNFRGPFVVLNAANDPAITGPTVAFFADVACSNAQKFAALIVARQGSAIGAGGGKATCQGGTQDVMVGVRKNPGSPNFSLLSGTLNVEGVGATNVTKPLQLNDLEFDNSTVTPLPISDFPPTLPLP